MKNIRLYHNYRFITRGLMTGVLLLFSAMANAVDPLHNTRWQTFDDETGKAKGVIEIREQNGVLFGRIVKLLAADGDKPCTTCKGKYANQVLVGQTIIKNLKAKGNGKYADGSIDDPEKGKTYRLKATLEAQQLKVRGFIGVSLLGRTQMWKQLP